MPVLGHVTHLHAIDNGGYGLKQPLCSVDHHTMAIDHEMLRSLHFTTGRHVDLGHEDRQHVLFQTSTIESLLDGAYDGDLTLAELTEHGDLGVGTFDACDGELILVDGRVYRASVDGHVQEAPPYEKTPFAVAVNFSADSSIEIQEPEGRERLLERVDRQIDRSDCYAIRIDGRFSLVRARSVARQERPYPPLAEVIAGQAVFEIVQTEGTMVGFRFPDYSQGINVAGYHLHFLASDRLTGGHVMDFEIDTGSVQIDHSVELHVELPPGVEMAVPDVSEATRRVIDELESG